MTNLTFEGFGRDERVAEEKSQWFSPPDIARRMRDWAGRQTFGRILEPSAGSGNLVHVARFDRSPDFTEAKTKSVVHACELDPYYLDRLAERFQDDVNEEDVRLVGGSYLDWESPRRFDLGLANPPYEDGLDGEFLAKMMGECDRIVALVRLACLAGAGRHAKVWSRLDRGDWRMPGLAIFSSRPQFQAGRAVGERKEGDSAKADFCVVKLSRAHLGETSNTAVEWW